MNKKINILMVLSLFFSVIFPMEDNKCTQEKYDKHREICCRILESGIKYPKLFFTLGYVLSSELSKPCEDSLEETTFLAGNSLSNTYKNDSVPSLTSCTSLPGNRQNTIEDRTNCINNTKRPSNYKEWKEKNPEYARLLKKVFLKKLSKESKELSQHTLEQTTSLTNNNLSKISKRYSDELSNPNSKKVRFDEPKNN